MRLNKLYILLIFILLGILLFCFYFNHSVIDKNLFSKIVDQSQFFIDLSSADLYARGFNCPKQYKSEYVSQHKDFTYYQRYVLNKLLKDIDIILLKYPILHAIPYKFVKVAQNIENGYPHTIKDVIVLTDNFFQLPYYKKISILIHEKIHVYQRLYTHKCQELICNLWNYIPVNFSKNYKLSRSNPDLNGILYKKNNIISLQIYNSMKPLSLADSKLINLDMNNNNITNERKNIHPPYIDQPEHPYEIQADISTKIILDLVDIDDDFLNTTKNWMINNF